MPATNAAMKPDPSSALADPVGERGAGRRDDLPPRRPRSGPRRPAWRDDRGDTDAGDDPAQHAVADLLEQQRARRCGRRRSSDLTSASATAANSSGTQIPSLSPLSTLSPWRIRCGTRGSVTTACPSAASVGASTIAEDDRLLDGQLAEQDGGRDGAERDRQRQADPEQPHRHADRAAEVRRGRRARRRRTAPGRASPRPAGARPSPLARSMPSSALGPTSSPNATNRIAGVIGVPASRRETAATPSSASATRTSVHSIRDIMAVGAALRDNSTARSPCAQRGGRRGVRIQAAVRPTAVRNETHAPLSA